MLISVLLEIPSSTNFMKACPFVNDFMFRTMTDLHMI